MANLVEVNEFANNLPAERRLPWTYRPEAVAHHTLSLRDFVRLLERHKRMILLVVALITLPVLAYQLLSPNLYSSSTQVQVQLIDEVGTNQADVANRNEVRVTNTVRLYRSRSSAEATILDLDLLSDPDFRAEMGEVPGDEAAQMHRGINTLLGMLTVTSEPNSDLMQVTITTKTPELSARIANQYPDSVSKVRTRRGAEQREELLQSLLAERAEREETFHCRHADAMLDALLSVPESADRLTAAFRHLLPIAVGIFEVVDGEAAALEMGVASASVANLLPAWQDLVVARFGPVDWQMVAPPAQDGRRLRSADFAARYTRMREVYMLDPAAVW
mgnify:CR=1 FL=1